MATPGPSGASPKRAAGPNSNFSTGPPAKRQLTFLAQKYTHPIGDRHKAIRGVVPFKSGLTPVALPAANATNAEKNRVRELEAYQRRRFQGFVTSELERIEAFAPLSNASVTAQDEFWWSTVPIHPIFQKKNWVERGLAHQSRFPIGVERYGPGTGDEHDDGFFDVNNPKVWKALEPCLKLASLLLENAHSWPWWDALFRVYAHTPIPAAELPEKNRNDGKDWKSFAPQPGWITYDPHMKAYMQNLFAEVADRIRFYLVGGGCDANTCLPTEGFSFGFTEYATFNNKSAAKMSLAVEILAPLLDGRPTDAERMIDRLRVVNTLLHEITHAIWNILQKDAEEPIFEGETIPELGFSLEKAMWGGVPVPYVEEIGMLKDVFVEVWLTVAHSASWPCAFTDQGAKYNENAPTLRTKPYGYYKRSLYPVPVQWFMDMNRREFWTAYIQRHGHAATYMGPLSIGIEKYFRRNSQGEDVLTNDGIMWGSPFATNPIAIDVSKMSAADVSAAMLENERRSQAALIQHLATLAGQERAAFDLEAVNTGIHSQADRPYAEGELESPDSPHVPRFNEIRQHLVAYYWQLGIHSFDSQLPENTMLKYILEHGVLKLTAHEWRKFLRRCEQEKILFRWRLERGLGILTRTDAGWPAMRGSSTHSAPRPPLQKWNIFKQGTDALQNNGWLRRMFPDDNFDDFDMDDFRRWLNQIKDPQTKQVPRRGAANYFSLIEILGCIEWCEDINWRFRYVPTLAGWLEDRVHRLCICTPK
ncbi:hypothetical protein BP6252_11474 [Coleophoma cylindrospora]|uniref:Uncharacterized protein n=1 Tax=Coleophoma cylindrospora TaxID=1849047 RepID=A0A3D8QJY8_9HELO|nr:hypothetical protein BP6252_11474 [Coleophoma cylindrospora]